MKAILITCCWLSLTAVAYCSDKPAATYEKAIIAITPTAKKMICKVQTQELAYQFSKCQELRDGEAVEYRLAERTLYIRTSDAKELKRSLEATELKHDPNNVPTIWLRGTIQGYSVHKEISGNNNSQSGLNIAFGGGKIKVYELHGAEANFLIDRCGSFQAGKFAPGQEVEYRVDGERLYVRHHGDKEYACQIEGRSLPDSPKPADGPKAATASGGTQSN